MKCCFLLYLLFFQHVNGYKVVNKPYQVYVKSVRGFIKQDQYILRDDSISFEYARGPLHVMNNEGNWEITKEKNPLANRSSSSSALWKELKSLIIPVQVKGKMQSRSGTMANLTDVEQYFNQYSTPESPLLIIDSLQLHLTYANFSDTSGYFFYIAYLLGTDTINKRIPLLKTKDKLRMVLDRRLFFVDGTDRGAARIGPATLFYYNTKDKTKTSLSTCYFHQVPFTALKTELGLVTGHIKDSVERSETIWQYLALYYGLPDTETFTNKYLPQLMSHTPRR